MKDIIFIHIPKTGGTTLNAAMQNTYWQTETNFNYRHIELKTKKSNAGDIFSVSNIEKYRNYKIFMMLRDPLDRVISEYYFIKERKNFMNLLNKEAKNFEEYILNFQTQNGVVNFLKGRTFFSKKPSTTQDLKEIIQCIDQIPITVGIFESFNKSMAYISKHTGIEWNNKIEVKRMTFKRPRVSEIDPKLLEIIRNNNQLDIQLYNYCKEKFELSTAHLDHCNVEFDKDKYNHVIPYVAQCCLFELCIDEKNFIRKHFEFFKQLTFFLLKNKQINEGKLFVDAWNKSFLMHLEMQQEHSPFTHFISAEFSKEHDPLQSLFKLGNGVDDYFKQNPKALKKMPKIDFNTFLVVVEEEKKVKKGFFNKLFGK